MRFPGGETVQRIPFKAKTANAHKREVIEYDDPLDIPGVAVAPGNQSGTPSEELIELTLYLDYDTETHPLDQWLVRGSRFDVDVATSGRWRSPHTGRRHGQVVTLRRAQG